MKGDSMKKDNIILIGMPGAGKSTIGVVLAKALGMNFLDTDLVIQERTNEKLQNIINRNGMEYFLNVEKEAILSINCGKHIIATGGSVVYKEESMAHLKQLGTIVYLDVSYEEIKRRINNITTRGIAIRKGATLKDIYVEREKLYNQYVEIKIDCNNKTVEEIVADFVENFENN